MPPILGLLPLLILNQFLCFRRSKRGGGQNKRKKGKGHGKVTVVAVPPWRGSVCACVRIGQRGRDCPHRWPEGELLGNPTTAGQPTARSQAAMHTHARTHKHKHTHSQPKQPANNPCLQDVSLFAASTSRQTECKKRLQSWSYLAFTSFRERLNMSAWWIDSV